MVVIVQLTRHYLACKTYAGGQPTRLMLFLLVERF